MHITKRLNAILMLTAFIISSCNSSSENKTTVGINTTVNINDTDTTFKTTKPIRCILQDKAENFWFGTDGDGVCRYDGKSFIWFTEKEGLCNNFVRTILEDKNGNLLLGTQNGVCSYDGKSFTIITNNATPNKEWQNKSGSNWFGTQDGACSYDGKSISCFSLPVADKNFPKDNSPTPYSVYSLLEDKNGNVWFGTEQRGVCRYDGKSFTWFTDKGLSDAAVRSIFQDKDGNLWFGNNGAGVFRYDGKSLINFTDEKGLSNPDFLKTLKSKSGTLARVWTIAQDKIGNLWFGTIDAGAWRYDGKSLTNFTIKDGLNSDAIWIIYKDNDGNLLFGTGEGSVYNYDGKSFINFTTKTSNKIK